MRLEPAQLLESAAKAAYGNFRILHNHKRIIMSKQREQNICLNRENRSHRDIACLFDSEIVWFYGSGGEADFVRKDSKPRMQGMHGVEAGALFPI
jgi:hypothetical protein